MAMELFWCVVGIAFGLFVAGLLAIVYILLLSLCLGWAKKQ